MPCSVCIVAYNSFVVDTNIRHPSQTSKYLEVKRQINCTFFISGVKFGIVVGFLYL